MRLATIKQSAGSFQLSDICLLLYFCCVFAHRTNVGIDGYLLRGSFVLYVVVFLFCDVFADIRRGEKRVLFGGMVIWLIAFWAFAWVSSLWSESIQNTLQGNYITNAIQAICLVMGITYRVRSKDDLVRIMTLLVVAGLYGAVILYMKTPSSAWGSERVGDAVGLNQNVVGLNNSWLCLLCVYLLHEKKKLWPLLLMIPFVLIALYSGSRKAFFIVVVGVAMIESFMHKGFNGMIAAVLAIAAAVALYQVVMTVPDLYNVLGYRIDSLLNDTGIDGSSQERAWYRQYAIEMWKDKPILGYGFNGFLTQMQAINYHHQAYSHCNQTELLADLGMVGFCLYYGLFVVLIRDFVKVLGRSRSDAVYGIAFLIIVFASDFGNVSFVGTDIYAYLALIYCLRNVIGPVRIKERVTNGPCRNVDTMSRPVSRLEFREFCPIGSRDSREMSLAKNTAIDQSARRIVEL